MKQKLRVLHAITNMRTGGAENLVRKILLSLDRDKYDCYLLLFEETGMYLDEIKKNEEISVLKLNSRFRRYNLFLLIEIINLLKQHEIDIVHTHLYKSNLYVRLAALMVGCRKIVFHEHGGIMKKPIRHRIAEFFLQYCTDCFIYISKHDMQYFSKHSWISKRRKMMVIPNPCVFDAPRPINQTNEKLIKVGMVGQISRMKGHIFCLQALAKLKEEGLNMEVFIVGDGAERVSLEKLCRDVGITAHFPGNVLNVSKYYNQFDIFVHPSLSEGFGMVIVEAMSAGLPVIATNVGGIPEIITHGENGILVEPASAESIKRAIFLLISDKEMRIRLSKNALKTYSDKYTFRKYIQQIDTIYSNYQL